MTEPSVLITGSGITYTPSQGADDRLQPRMPGEHVWVSLAAFRLTEESAKAAMVGGGQVHLDMENLASINVGCFVCEEPWTQRTAHRRCKGEPR